MVITAAPPATSSSSSRILSGIIATAADMITVAVGVVMFESHPAATYLVGI